MVKYIETCIGTAAMFALFELQQSLKSTALCYEMIRCLLYCTDLGLGIGHVETVSDGSCEHSSWCCSQPTSAVFVFRWRGQAGQVLGLRVQQGMILQS